MPHAPPLVATIALGLVLAFSLGVVAHRLKLPPLVGYLVAGIVIGPFTPGFVADQNIANQLAEVGVILLMFGVGLHFSPKDLLSVRAIAIPGAAAQALIAIPLGIGVGWLLGWSLGAGIIFGIALAVASTVVVLRVLQERRLLETERGRITVGWLIVQDIAMILVLVLLPGLAALFHGMETAPKSTEILLSVTTVLGKFAIFVAVMLIVGKKLIPAILHYVAHTGSRELFRLAVLSIALGVAYAAAELFGISLALGAFFAGMILSEFALSQQAATESLPLRDAFAVLFFVSVGMLFNPTIVANAPLALLATVLIILIAKSVAAYGVVRLFGHAAPVALVISASLAQIGEFSFILANRSLEFDLHSRPRRATSFSPAPSSPSCSIRCCSPRSMSMPRGARSRRSKRRRSRRRMRRKCASLSLRPRSPGHVVLVGHGRVGGFISAALRERKIPLFIIEDSDDRVAALRQLGVEAITGNAADPEVIAGGEFERRALPARGHPRRVRGRPGGAAGPRHQSRSPHCCQGAFRGGDRPPQTARRQYRGDGRA